MVLNRLLANLWLITCLAVLSVGSPCAAEALIFADSFPVRHPISKDGNVWWMDRVSDLTGGEISFRHFPAEQLAHADGILQKVRDGVAQVGYVGVGYVSDELPLNGVAMLPDMVTDTVAASDAYWKLLNSNTLFRREFLDAGVVPVFAVLLPPYQVVLNRPPVRTMSDLDGLKLRVSGSMILVADEIAASPVAMAAPDVYMAMQRGTLDGALLPVTSVVPYRIDEITRSISTDGSFGSFAIVVVMNARTHAELGPTHQAAIRRAGHETVAHLAHVLERDVAKALTAFRDQGIAVYSLPAKTRMRLSGRFSNVQESWVHRMEKRGIDGQQALRRMKEALDEQPSVTAER